MKGVVGYVFEFFVDVLLDGGRIRVLGKDHGDYNTGFVGVDLGTDGMAENIVFKNKEITVVHVHAFQGFFRHFFKCFDDVASKTIIAVAKTG